MYHVYILQCSDDTLYTGITTDLARRVKEHNSSSLGAKYTHSRRPVTLVYSKQFSSRSAAQIEESRIKKLSRSQKECVIARNVATTCLPAGRSNPVETSKLF